MVIKIRKVNSRLVLPLDISNRLTPQPSGSGGGGAGLSGTSISIGKSELIGRSITSILGSSSSSRSAEISGSAMAGPSTSALPPMQQVPLVRRRRMRRSLWKWIVNVVKPKYFLFVCAVTEERNRLGPSIDGRRQGELPL